MKTQQTLNSAVKVRVNSAIKEKAIRRLGEMGVGVSLSDLVRILLYDLANGQELPVSIRRPNRETMKAIENDLAGKSTRFDNVEDLFEDLGI